MLLRKTAFTIKKKIKKLIRDIQPHYKTADKYWIQEIPYSSIEDRMNLFIPECKDKNVLHFGCTDWPVFNAKNNLHIKLSKHTKSIDGFDIDKAGIEVLKQYVNQDYFFNYNNLPTKKYDVCLIPETIEHVDNIQIFLEQISKINASKFLITAPNCFSKVRMQNFHTRNNQFIEVVHPDHNAWFSPYTLKNIIEKYSTLEVVKFYLLHKGRMVCCEAKQKHELT